MNRFALLCFLLFPVAGIGGAVHPELSDRVAARIPAGCANYRALFIDLYRAELWTDAQTMPGEQFGLTLIYSRGFSRHILVSTSIAEMARMSDRPEDSFGPVRTQLERIMRKVSNGDRFTAWRKSAEAVEFFFNGQGVGVLNHDSDLFLDIWLGNRSRKPAHRQKLLSGRCASGSSSSGS